MTDQDRQTRLEVSALRLGRSIDRAFERECERRKLDPEYAVLAPIASLTTSTQEPTP